MKHFVCIYFTFLNQKTLGLFSYSILIAFHELLIFYVQKVLLFITSVTEGVQMF